MRATLMGCSGGKDNKTPNTADARARLAPRRATSLLYATAISAAVAMSLATTAFAAAPNLNSNGNATGTVGVPFSYQMTANQSITTWGATGLPPGLTVNTTTGSISGTPTTAGT